MVTKEFRKKVHQIFYHYKNLLEIPKYWHIRITTSDKLKWFAEVTYDYQSKKFDIVINPKLNQDLEDLKDSILHELLHILFTPGTSRIELMLQKIQCNEKFSIKHAKKNLSQYEEAIVAHLAKVIINQEKRIHD